MSIEVRCRAAERKGFLLRYIVEHRPAKRRLFLTREAANDLSDRGVLKALGLRPAVRARFDEWVGGSLVTSETGGKPSFLKQLDAPPFEVWEIRITAPLPQARAIGRFVSPDSYLVTGVYSRNYLGRYGSEAWKSAEQACLERWRLIFGDLDPFHGDSYLSYVTENCNAFRLGRILSEGECEVRGRKGKRRSPSRHKKTIR